MRYAVAGVLSNLALIALFGLALEMDFAPTVAAALIYWVGLVVTYFVHRNWSFSSNRPHLTSSSGFFLVHCVGMALMIAFQAVFHDQLGVPAILVQAAAVLITAGIVFLLLDKFVFRSDEST